jgi:metallo-beta-lactamase class B
MPFPPVSQVARVQTLLLVLLATAWTLTPAQTPSACAQCAELNVSQEPFRVYGNTYYVGVHGLSSILITSPRGHVLIDGALSESAPKIAANVRALGFRIEDVKLILNSHVHYDHAGGIAELQRMSGAVVAASEPTALVLKSGHSGPDDPQFGILSPIPTVATVRIVKDLEILRVGPLVITAHFTPGHTRGGTSWTWRSCEQERCLHIAYLDSLTPISADDFRFSRSRTYPEVLQDFEHSFATITALPCDILLTPHPSVSNLWERLQKRDKDGDPNAFVDQSACKRYADNARANLQKRLAQEAAGTAADR